MGQLDQFAKDTFATEAPKITHGAVAWQLLPDLGMAEVRLDGLFRVVTHAPLAPLAAPWRLVDQADELIVQITMQDDPADLLALDRAQLRLLARQVQRREDPEQKFDGETSLWFVTADVPEVIARRRTLTPIAPGCYQVGPPWLATLWIAANELPLADELVPFLVARTGQPLDAFARWVETRQPPLPWFIRMLKLLPMSTATHEELWRRTLDRGTGDLRIPERRRHMKESFFAAFPEVREEIAMATVRKGLREILETRGLTLGAEDTARIDACTNLGILHRWVKQAADAATAAEALR